MDTVNEILITIIVIIAAGLLGLGIFQIIKYELHTKYQSTYENNNEWYFPRHRKKHHPKRYHKGCLRGCRADKTCPKGNLCYNCKGGNASCCCYDNQCSKCEY